MFEIESVGESSAERIAELLAIVQTARQDDAAEIDQLLAKSLDRLKSTASTISVVGQVKSGKSSLINALTGLGDFLPTEVNPWTAVITNLHFGHPDKPESGALFELFSEAEWLRMIEGDPETRRMAEELLPGFRSDVLRQQVLEMQQSAERRLGALYKLLLGKKHRFNDITPEVLERYVSAGYSDGVNEQSSAGRFSGITKSASVFLPAGPFRVPVTLSDTPGINDPFLVRDEITTNSFRVADIFIVTLSVHQVLGPADIALLKMLAVHQGKKTVIYVNRIDELENPAKSVPELLKSLDERLQQELDRPNYLLLAGSAHWGRLAVKGTDEAVAAALASPAFESVAATVNDDAGRSPRERLYDASGMRLLAQCLSSLVAEGKMRDALAETITECRSALDLLGQVLRERSRKERGGPIDTDDVVQIVETERERISRRMESLAELGNSLATISNRGQGEILSNGDVVLNSIANVIDASVNAFVQEQSRDLKAALACEGDVSAWKINMESLCRRVEDQVVKGYKNGRQEIDRILVRYAERLNGKMRPMVGDMSITRILENLPFDEIMPGFKPRSSLVEMEFSANRGWRFWRSKTMSADEAVERVARIIFAETHPATEQLRQTVQEAIVKRNGAAMERLRNLLDAAQHLLEIDIRTLREEMLSLSRGGTRERIAQIYDERNRRTEEIESRVAILQAAQEMLNERFGDLMEPEVAMPTSDEHAAAQLEGRS